MLETRVRIHPERNTALEGLYLSSGNFCTQCEAEGFRRITYFPDRPDVMARYRVRIEADRERYPVLLSNGNRIGQGELAGRPSLRALAGPVPQALLSVRAGRRPARPASRTASPPRSGRTVALRDLRRAARDRDQCEHAMASLKRAMRWDEERFGLEYDLDVFMIVAVADFNMGAMENKGLNIFNTKYVLAQPDDRHRRRLPRHRGGDRARVLPQLDRQPRHLPRLVPALAEGRPDRVPRPGVHRRPAFARGQAHRRRAAPAREAVPRGRRPDGAPGAAARATSRSTTSTPPPSTRRAPRSSACSTRCSARTASGAAWTLLRAPRRPGRDLRRLRRRDGGRPRAATSTSSSAGTARPARRGSRSSGEYDAGDPPLHADASPVDAADAGPAREGAAAHPARRRPAGRATAASCRCSSRARAAPSGTTRVLELTRAEAALHLHRACRRRRCRRCCAASRRR